MNAPRLRLEFAPGTSRRSTLGWVMLACSSALLVAQLVPLGIALSAREHGVRALADLDTRRADSAPSRAPTAKPDPAYVAKVRASQQVARSLAAPWPDLLDAIESAPQSSVALLAVEPSASKQSFRMTAEGRDAKAMLAYLAALQNDRRLASVVLVSHQLQVQTPGRPIRFQLQGAWGVEP